jgi:adenosine deaminase
VYLDTYNFASFFELFRFIYQLTDDEESVRIATRSVVQEFAKDGVKYLELRTTPRKDQETGEENWNVIEINKINQKNTYYKA